MTPLPGTRIGPYEIVAALGAGGMGEVYRARDTNLHREVALKLLPATFAADVERAARFDREARTLAALNHPNIAQVFGIERRGADACIVMELVEGDELAARIAQGPMAIDEALPIARQIAEALEAAHEQGIVHRDLKPANIKVRPDGTVKVLDFGLAKGSPVASAMSPELPKAPTVTSPAEMTVVGSILGTAAYMAPEQARGRAIDKRADIWAFGCVLYEMLTGRRPFVGETITETLAAVMKDPVPLERLPASTPPSVRRLIARCLERDPTLRLRDIGEARIALTKPDDAPVTQARRGGVSRATVAAFAAAGLVLSVITGVVAWRAKPAPDVPVRRFVLPGDIAEAISVALSPDGSRIASIEEGTLRVRALDALVTQELGQVPMSASTVVWSPDSRTIGFAAEGTIRTIPATGGPTFTVCRVPASGRISGLAWRPDGMLVIAAWRENVYAVPASGGEPKVLVKLDPKTEIDVHRMSVLPDNRVILEVHQVAGGLEAMRHELFNGTERTLLSDAADIRALAYAPPNHLIFARTGSNAGVWTLPWSDGPLDLTKAVLVEPEAAFGEAGTDGTMLVDLPGAGLRDFELVWVDRKGAAQSIPGPALDLSSASGASRLSSLALAPDATRIAFAAETPPHLFVRDVQSGVDTRLTFEPTLVAYPAWSPAGDRILFRRSPVVSGETIAVRNADGSGELRDLSPGTLARFAPDGRTVLFLVGEPGRSHLRTALMQPDGTLGSAQRVFASEPEPVLLWFDLSPDGTLLVYQARQLDQRSDVFLTEFPAARSRWLVASGAVQPRFTSEGREIVYLTGSRAGPRPTGMIAAISITTRPTVKMGPPVILFALGSASTVEPSNRLSTGVRIRCDEGRPPLRPGAQHDGSGQASNGHRPELVGSGVGGTVAAIACRLQAVQLSSGVLRGWPCRALRRRGSRSGPCGAGRRRT